MKKNIITTLSAVFLLSPVATFLHADSSTTLQENSFKEISDLHLSSLPAPLVKEKKAKAENEKTLYERLTQLEEPDFDLAKTSKYEDITFSYLMLSNYLTTLQETALNINGYKDLELFCGTGKKEINLLQLLNRTHLPESEVFLANLLAHPITDITELKKRQALILTLIDNKEATSILDKALSEVKEHHDAIASFWRTDHSTTQKLIASNFYSISALKGLNTSPTYQHLGLALRGTLKTLSSVVPLAIFACVDYSFIKYRNDPIMPAICAAYGQTVASAGVVLALYSAFVGLGSYINFDDIQKDINTLKYLQEKAIGMARIVKAVKAIQEIVELNPELQNLSYAKTIKEFALVESSLSSKIQQLIKVLDTNTFKDKKPSPFALHGRSRLAYALIEEIKNELTPAFTAIAEVDAYLSCAKLYKEYENSTNHFSFAIYIEQDTPRILLYNMWNPFVGAEKSVANSIELGGKNPLNMILTGPNAGGKSTFSKGVTLNILLGQTIGIVPAEILAFTPFAKINTYMNIADDTAGGNSLFKSEVMRAQQLLETINKLDKNQFAFSVMDEVFSGTSPKEGEAASCAVAKNLTAKTNSIAIVATHFPKMKELAETNKGFKNYQVRVVRNANGSFSYPFKLEYGAADQNVAIELLQREGFESSIIQDALDILNESPTTA